MTNTSRPFYKVIIIKALIKQYRLVFFEQLHKALLKDGVELKVFYSKQSRDESQKCDNIELPDKIGSRIPGYYIFGHRLLLQLPHISDIYRSDLIIVVNAHRNLLNLPLLFLSRLGLKRVALWGHDQNYQKKNRVLSETIRRKIAQMPNWWFSYTERTANILVSAGFNKDNITVINNAVDTSNFKVEVDSVSDDELISMRSRLGISNADQVVLFCGALYPEKRVSMMIDAADRLAKQNSSFRLVVVGSGVDADKVVYACKYNSAIHYMGSLFGRDKAILYKLCDFVFNPGLIGLSILDAFAAGKPVVTMSDSLHSPEISYLTDDVNGVMVDGDVSDLVSTVIDLLDDKEYCRKLAVGAAQTGAYYSLESMVDRVRDGVLKNLKCGV